jgi:hypothetical protein
VLIAAAAVAAMAASASVIVPGLTHLKSPELAILVTGVVMVASGLAILRFRAVGPAGWLLLAAGVIWYLPDLAVIGLAPVDVALRCLALLPVALMIHAIAVVGSPRTSRRGEQLAVTLGYVAAASGAIGAAQVTLPLAGLAIALVVTLPTRSLPRIQRQLRSAAGLVLGLGLVVTALVRVLAPPAGRPALTAYCTALSLAALLTALAATRRLAFDVTRFIHAPDVELIAAISGELGVEGLDVAFCEPEGGWLDAAGTPRSEPSGGTVVLDPIGRPIASMVGRGPKASLPHDVESLLVLAARNARLRRSIQLQIDELQASRHRLLHATDVERHDIAAQLREAVIGPLAGIERELARAGGLGAASERASRTRAQLEGIARGVDPLAPEGSLRLALERLAATSPCAVRVEHCDDPRTADVARAVWFCCAEATANTAKHAPASALRIDVRRVGCDIRAEISDDGPGGADAHGRGLRGLRDRIEAVGGRLLLESPPAAGTRMTVLAHDVGPDCGRPQSTPVAGVDEPAVEVPYRHGSPSTGGSR